MWECAYGKEPLDLKLLLLRLMKKIWIPLLAALGGAALAGGIYFLSEIAGQGITYEAVSTYYVDYGTDPLTDNAFTYINGATWNDVWVKSDDFAAGILEKAGDEAADILGHALTAAELKGYLGASLETDLRMPLTTVATGDPGLTMVLCRALEETMVEFGDSQKEINSIRVVISPEEAKPAAVDNRTGRAAILGAVLGAFFASVILVLAYMLDDSIYVPCTFEYRYRIPMLGTLGSAELLENFHYLFAGKKRIALLPLAEESDAEETAKELRRKCCAGSAGHQECCAEAAGHQECCAEAAGQQEETAGAAAWELIPMPAAGQCPEVCRKLREADGLLLLVEAGAHDGKRIEHTLNLLKTQEIPVTAALLVHADEGLQKAYYLPGFWADRS